MLSEAVLSEAVLSDADAEGVPDGDGVLAGSAGDDVLDGEGLSL